MNLQPHKIINLYNERKGGWTGQGWPAAVDKENGHTIWLCKDVVACSFSKTREIAIISIWLCFIFGYTLTMFGYSWDTDGWTVDSIFNMSSIYLFRPT
jgi:hypothetical protein